MKGDRVEAVVDTGQGVQTFDIVAKGSVDLVLMDVQMPIMDGLESTAAIRRHEQASASHIPIIAVPAWSRRPSRQP